MTALEAHTLVAECHRVNSSGAASRNFSRLSGFGFNWETRSVRVCPNFAGSVAGRPGTSLIIGIRRTTDHYAELGYQHCAPAIDTFQTGC